MEANTQEASAQVHQITENDYHIVNGTAYDLKTSKKVIDVLEMVRSRDIRVKVRYGDTETGRDYKQEYFVTGRIGRSTGKFKIPLMIYNKRSTGGVALMDQLIVKISYANKKEGGVLYQHEKYYTD